MKELLINCSPQAVENEKHFLLTCPLYHVERNSPIDSRVNDIENVDSLVVNSKFVDFMKNRNENVMRSQDKCCIHYLSYVKCFCENKKK